MTNIGFLAAYNIIESAVSGPMPLMDNNSFLSFSILLLIKLCLFNSTIAFSTFFHDVFWVRIAPKQTSSCCFSFLGPPEYSGWSLPSAVTGHQCWGWKWECKREYIVFNLSI